MANLTKYKTIWYSVSVLFFIGFSSCKKDSTPKSKTDLLTQSSWQITKRETKTGAGAWVAVPPSLPCSMDDYRTFRTNLSWDDNEGATKCSPSDPQISNTGSWSFLFNESQLYLSDVSGASSIFNIEQLDENTLVLSIVYTSGGIIYTGRYTSKH